MGKRKKKEKYPIFVRTTLIALLVLSVAFFLIYKQVEKYENGLLDVCATQQDGYVQLVLDQINLKDNRDDAEIIRDILGTLDASNSKYWTFARGESMLFVKDVLETNKYKNFDADAYYDTESARAFLDTLQLDRVTHSQIVMDGVDYIASGVAFSYNGGEYRLCLLTNRSVLLDNNYYLGARVELITLVLLIFVMTLLTVAVLSHRLRHIMYTNSGLVETNKMLNERLEGLNARLNQQDLYDTKTNFWSSEFLRSFITKIRERNAFPVSIIRLHCADENALTLLQKNMPYALDKSVLRFSAGTRDVILVFVKEQHAQIVAALKPLLNENVKADKLYSAEKAEDFDVDLVIREFEPEGK